MPLLLLRRSDHFNLILKDSGWEFWLLSGSIVKEITHPLGSQLGYLENISNDHYQHEQQSGSKGIQNEEETENSVSEISPRTLLSWHKEVLDAPVPQ